MATLYNLQNNEKIKLLPQHFFGRQAGTANTVLNNPNISRVHALLFWDGVSWLLQDSSTNGTFVNEKQVFSGAKKILNKGDKIQFGSTHADIWQLLEVDAPKSMLVPITAGVDLVELDTIVVLPSIEIPEISIYMNDKGKWVCESASGVSVLTNGDHVGTHDNIWCFIEAAESKKTQKLVNNITDLSQIRACFSVSQNEEHVSLSIHSGKYSIKLEERTHHYLLLLLARKRVSDIVNEVKDSEQGWININTLMKMMKLTDLHINTQVYRARQQLFSTMSNEVIIPQIIERRPGELRFAYPIIEITGGVSTLFELAACK